MDAFIAATILVFGLIVAFSSQVYTRNPAQEITYSDSTLKALGYTKAAEVSSDYIHNLVINGTIKNLGNTVLQQAGEFYYFEQKYPGSGFLKQAGALIENAVPANSPPAEFGLEVKIEGTTVYNRSNHDDFEPDILSSSKMIISSIDMDTMIMWGPYVAEVNVWRK